MVQNDLVIVLFLVIFSAMICGAGKIVIYKEILDVKKHKESLKASNQWLTASIFISVVVIANYIFQANKSFWKIQSFINLSLLLYCLFISIVDIYTQNFYLEMLFPLVFLMGAGWYSFGPIEMAKGFLLGLALNVSIVLLEIIVTKRRSYGWADFIFSTVASAIVGFTNAFNYWFLVAVFFILYFLIVFVINKFVYKKKDFTGEYVPLLPVMTIPACIVYIAATSGTVLSM